jgi:hypothetical protein
MAPEQIAARRIRRRILAEVQAEADEREFGTIADIVGIGKDDLDDRAFYLTQCIVGQVMDELEGGVR